jgi:hypothetical protein
MRNPREKRVSKCQASTTTQQNLNSHSARSVRTNTALLVQLKVTGWMGGSRLFNSSNQKVGKGGRRGVWWILQAGARRYNQSPHPSISERKRSSASNIGMMGEVFEYTLRILATRQDSSRSATRKRFGPTLHVQQRKHPRVSAILRCRHSIHSIEQPACESKVTSWPNRLGKLLGAPSTRLVLEVSRQVYRVEAQRGSGVSHIINQ